MSKYIELSAFELDELKHQYRMEAIDKELDDWADYYAHATDDKNPLPDTIVDHLIGKYDL